MRFTVGLDRTVGRSVYRIHRGLYRLSRGWIGHRTPVGPILLLTTTGRRSGRRRSVPLLYFATSGHYFVVGSNGGRPSPPAWIHNVQSEPRVSVQVGPRRFAAVAQLSSSAERDDLWPRLTEFYPGWAHYESLTDRPINVVRISESTTTHQ
jgi:deazaflavin-dependent oxidoreductase (nitroreductase family)